MQEVKSIRDADVAGKRVLLRTSLNVPINADSTVGDEFRLKRALETIQYLREKGASKIILVGYLGREGASLKPVTEALQKLAPDLDLKFGDVDGSCVMLENIRQDTGEEKNDTALAQKLAAMADIFVNDAFAEAHRAYASNVGVAKLLPAYAGLLMEREVEQLSKALTPPPGSVAVIGGAKFETKVPLIEKLLSLYETILLGGALGNGVIKARGMPVGASLVSTTPVPESIAGNDHLLVANDAAVVDTESHMGRSSLINDVRAHESILDIGPATAQDWANILTRAPFVLWNGPMGVYEKGFIEGTEMLASALANSAASAVVGGGDTAAALAKFSFDPAKVFISTGGGAMLQFLVDGTLPAIEVLKK